MMENNVMWVYVSYENKNQASWYNCRWDADKKRWYLNLKYANAKDFQEMINNKNLTLVKKYHVLSQVNRNKGYRHMDHRHAYLVEPYTREELKAILETIKIIEKNKIERKELEPNFID